jgi:hypothetical protein
MNGDPLRACHWTWVAETLPEPPGRIASVGPARPEETNTKPFPATGVGVTSTVFPSQYQSSAPVSGS